MHYDVFNGDADGIIALLQLRLAQPKASTLITGVKRDIQLLQQVPVRQATSVTVLDISMEKNIVALEALLAHNVEVFYVDHHRTGEIPTSAHLDKIIDIDANTCTSLLVNQYLTGKYALWAIVGAFGDNMLRAAEQLAQQAGLLDSEQAQLKNLGIYINYNGYGRTVDDLHIAPDVLFTTLLGYPDPFTLINEANSIFAILEQAYLSDMAQAKQASVLHDDTALQLIELEDAAWSRRVSGVYGNALANQEPDKAHAVITLNIDASYTVSLRAPINNKVGAGELCAQFDTGGGRAAAAGINQLPKEKLGKFIALVSKYYQ
ncbi:DHH family phosphoesterase [Colwellia sp. MB02u-10]|uniref:DHHA1 domain-containing protein n=1 Tax=Colwellia sp. MB02u-10 TaxID=2759828 RepID=UPI0015F396B7|nr:DHHA1 domain-containing protein [Colwellia sp. MB02u-10]MBA6342104.1 DHH family phosphoesterase [Colwellia sp. MB02u-10]